MRAHFLKFWQTGCAAVCTVLLVGCASQAAHVSPVDNIAASAALPDKNAASVMAQPIVAPKREIPMREFVPTGAVTVEYHVWQPTDQMPDVVWRGAHYKMYTYVLFNGPANQGKLRADEKKALSRLVSLLDTVGRSEDLASTPENRIRVQQDTNVFLIPATTSKLTAATLDSYNIPLSRAYLDYFSKALVGNQKLHKSLRKYGPFLLSTLKPIGEILRMKPDGTFQVDTNQPILLVDMSNAHENSVAEIVRTFKNHVADAPMTDTAAFEPLRLKLVSLLLKLNDAIPLVNNAVAGSCGLVGAEALCK